MAASHKPSRKVNLLPSVCTVGCEPRIRVGDVFHVLAKGGEDVDSTGLEISEEVSSAVAVRRKASVLVPSTVSR